MPVTTIARRYAQAMFELARESGRETSWQADMGTLHDALSGPAVQSVLEHPAVSQAEKERMLDKAAAGIEPVVVNLVKLLVSRSSLKIFGEIVAEYGKLYDESRGIETGSIVTAVPLGDDEKKKLSGEIGGMLGKTVELKPVVDPEILGGMVARVGGKLLDGSTRSKLAALKRQLAYGELRR